VIVRFTSKRQVTFPKRVLEHFKLKVGDSLELSETENGVIIRPRRFSRERLAPLRHQIPDNSPPLDLDAVRHAAHESDLRD
jgi:AbrB family looped-hinge helix DNA binding protein